MASSLCRPSRHDGRSDRADDHDARRLVHHQSGHDRLEFPPLIEATPAAPADVPTSQRFGALRNPPVWERVDHTMGLHAVGLIHVLFRERIVRAAFFLPPHAGYACRLSRLAQQPTSPPRGGEVNSRSELGEGAGFRIRRRRLMQRFILHDAPSPARLRERPLPLAGAKWALARCERVLILRRRKAEAGVRA
jgi:hypothetical protein